MLGRIPHALLLGAVLTGCAHPVAFQHPGAPRPYPVVLRTARPPTPSSPASEHVSAPTWVSLPLRPRPPAEDHRVDLADGVAVTCRVDPNGFVTMSAAVRASAAPGIYTTPCTVAGTEFQVYVHVE